MKNPTKSYFDRYRKDTEFKRHYKEASQLLDIAIKIAELRRKKKITQTELARLLDTSQTVISRIESGKENFSLKKLFRIADILGVRIHLNFT